MINGGICVFSVWNYWIIFEPNCHNIFFFKQNDAVKMIFYDELHLFIGRKLKERMKFSSQKNICSKFWHELIIFIINLRGSFSKSNIFDGNENFLFKMVCVKFKSSAILHEYSEYWVEWGPIELLPIKKIHRNVKFMSHKIIYNLFVPHNHAFLLRKKN